MARALATQPRLLLLDEVMAGLNPAEIDQAVALLGKLSQRGLTILIVEHVMRAIMAVARHIVVLDHGLKIAEGAQRRSSQNQDVIRAYLGSGYVHFERGREQMLALSGVSAGYGAVPAISDVNRDRRRRSCGLVGSKWRRQKHDACARFPDLVRPTSGTITFLGTESPRCRRTK